MYITYISYVSFTNITLTIYIPAFPRVILHLNILKGSEFLKSVGSVCQICGPLFTIESIPYFTVDLYSWLLMMSFKEYKQSRSKNISHIIGGDKYRGP